MNFSLVPRPILFMRLTNILLLQLIFRFNFKLLQAIQRSRTSFWFLSSRTSFHHFVSTKCICTLIYISKDAIHIQLSDFASFSVICVILLVVFCILCRFKLTIIEKTAKIEIFCYSMLFTAHHFPFFCSCPYRVVCSMKFKTVF